nr:XRE family transcriptional regulator [Corynebacterium suranareeae]
MNDRAGNVWDFLSDTPGEAENLRLRSQLLSRINERLDEFGWSQKVSGENLDLTQPRVSDLMNGKISKFSLDALVNIGIKVGVHMRVDDSESNVVPTHKVGSR